MTERYPLCLYDKNNNWKTVYNEEEERNVAAMYRPFGYDWSKMTVDNEKPRNETLIQQNLFSFDVPETTNECIDHEDNKSIDVLEEPSDRRNKRGRKPYKRD